MEVAYPNPEYFPEVVQEGVPATIEPSVKPTIGSGYHTNAYVSGIPVPVQHRPSVKDEDYSGDLYSGEIIIIEPFSDGVWNETKAQEALNPEGTGKSYRLMLVDEPGRSRSFDEDVRLYMARQQIKTAALIGGYITIPDSELQNV